jgi:hypothetical protein
VQITLFISWYTRFDLSSKSISLAFLLAKVVYCFLKFEGLAHAVTGTAANTTYPSLQKIPDSLFPMKGLSLLVLHKVCESFAGLAFQCNSVSHVGTA